MPLSGQDGKAKRVKRSGKPEDLPEKTSVPASIPGFADQAALNIRMKYGIPVSVNPVRGFFFGQPEKGGNRQKSFVRQ